MEELILKETGYYQVKNKPSLEELNTYYNNKYYQNNLGGYKKEYSEDERLYFGNKSKSIEYCLRKILNEPIINKKIIDIGCGEGWNLSYFEERDNSVKGIDFSSESIKLHNPKVLDKFEQIDINDYLKKADELFDVLILQNVIEHVLNPEYFLTNVKKNMKDNSVLVITFPNDFSDFQKLLIKENKAKDLFWVGIPDHISYFNKISFNNMAESLGFDIKLILSDFPIDLFILNDHSNYKKDKIKGCQANITKIKTMNLLFELDFESTLNAFLNFGLIGFGRNLTFFLTINKDKL